jgi:leucyl/phenylalanyl-tRNA--protein transferase
MKDSFPYFREDQYFKFPPVQKAQKDGLLAVGGNLSPGMLLSAYRQGIFPWYSEETPILWFSPDPRFVLYPEKLHIPERLSRKLKQNRFKVDYNIRFDEIIKGCRTAYRPGQEGTWITEGMEAAYIKLFELGYIFCAAITEKGSASNELAGGIYGVKIGNVFCGESMFAAVDDASKYGFVQLVERLKQDGVKIIDCQMQTKHLERFGAEMISRSEFLRMLNEWGN